MTETAVFTAPWDQRITVLTVLIASLLLGSTIVVAWLALARVPSTGVRLLFAASALVTLAALAGGGLLAPRRYAVRAGPGRTPRAPAGRGVPAPVTGHQDLPPRRASRARFTVSTKRSGASGVRMYVRSALTRT